MESVQQQTLADSGQQDGDKRKHGKPKRRLPRFRMVLLAIVVVLMAMAVFLTVKTHLATRFEQLDEADQQTLSQYAKFAAATEHKGVWRDFPLYRQPVVSIDTDTHSMYLINPEHEPGWLFAARITMPQDSPLKVYRLSSLTPGMQPILRNPLSGNFPQGNKPLPTVAGNTVFWQRYSSKKASQDPAQTFLALVSHESFHKLKQEQWNWDGSEGDTGRFFTDTLKGKKLEILGEGYESLTIAQQELGKKTPDVQQVRKGVTGYLDAMDRLNKLDPEFVRKYAGEETYEGTAQYVRDKAVRSTGTTLRIMHFSNKDNVPFSYVVPRIQSGKMDASFLSSDLVYETGATLCEAMDTVGFDYQTYLDTAKPGNTKTLLQLARTAMQQ
ncbi:hypothetical protein [Bifidobacterium catulorum]|uniref:Uncharacterized protein n=1 Tax=Bifidobacterium catulorum TaxID=1630173 RepID=A0A2U2MUL4_9BIFI|nr:hypothetical protein [Bifidobacterium catulorum]PWG60563.1 hypothetical protein DF200_01370 [Bifidobacterium catulorum]